MMNLKLRILPPPKSCQSDFSCNFFSGGEVFVGACACGKKSFPGNGKRRLISVMQKILVRSLLCFAYFIFAGALLALPLRAQSKRAVPVSAKALVAGGNADESDLGDSRLETLPGENFSAPWPRSTKIADMLPARIVEEKEKHYVYETEHFSFTCTAPIQLSSIREIARIFEGTYVANLALPLNSPCNYYQVAEKGKLRAVLFETREEYLQNVGEELSNSAGVCQVRESMERSRILLPFESLGLERAGAKYKRGTRKIPAQVLAHELTHFMTLPGYSYPSWFVEGIAEYVGITDYNNGRFAFTGNKKEISAYVAGYGKDGNGGRAIGKKIQFPVSLREFMELSYRQFLRNPQFNYGFSTLLAYYFFHLDGKKDAARIKAFIRVIQSGKSVAEAHEALLDGRSWAQLEKEVARGLRSLGFKVEFPKRKKSS